MLCGGEKVEEPASGHSRTGYTQWNGATSPNPERGMLVPLLLRARARINSLLWASIHPAWRRGSSRTYHEYAQSSRLARRVSQHPTMGSYSCANPQVSWRCVLPSQAVCPFASYPLAIGRVLKFLLGSEEDRLKESNFDQQHLMTLVRRKA